MKDMLKAQIVHKELTTHALEDDKDLPRDDWEKDNIFEPFTRFGLIEWSALRDLPPSALPLGDFKQWEGFREAHMLTKGAKSVSGREGDAYWYS